MSQLQSLRQGKSCLPVGVAEVRVAAAHGKAVGFSNGRAGANFDRDVQVVDHVANQQLLLIVLLPEEGDVRQDHVEQLQDNRSDASEMAGAVSAFQRCRAPGNFYERGVFRRVDGVGVRVENQIDSRIPAFSQVVFERPRIFRQVFVWSKLSRVHENRNNDEIGLLSGCFDQRDVSIVQRAHCWHAADFFSGSAG